MTHWDMFQHFTRGMTGNTVQEFLPSTLVSDCASHCCVLVESLFQRAGHSSALSDFNVLV